MIELKKINNREITLKASEKKYHVYDIDAPADPNFFTVYKIQMNGLKSIKRKGIVCSGESWNTHVSLEEIQNALGEYFTLELPVQEHDGSL